MLSRRDTPPCGSPHPRETWGGASGVGTCCRDVALWSVPGMDEGWIIPGVTGFVFNPMSGCLGLSCGSRSLPERWLPG